MSSAQAFAAAAEALVGTPFRLRGRDPVTGLDCIGLVVASLAAIGREVPPLPHYHMRNLSVGRFLPLLGKAGFRACSQTQRVGDLGLLKPSAAQAHLAIVGPRGDLIHAHGGLGRVIASPAPLPWPQLAQWRLQEV